MDLAKHIADNAPLTGLSLEQCVIREWPDTLWQQPLEWVELQEVALPEGLPERLFQLPTLKRLSLVSVVIGEDWDDEDETLQTVPDLRGLTSLEKLDLASLHPLTTRGYLSDDALTKNLQGGQLSPYDSPDDPNLNGEFYAVLTDGDNPDVVIVVADTDEFPGHSGTVLHGLYVMQGSELTPARDL